MTHSARLLAGWAKSDITPPLTIPYLGFAPKRHSFFEGVHDRLHARAVALRQEGRLVILLSADAIGFDNHILGPGRSFTGEVRRRVRELCRDDTAEIMLTATHAHSTPETLNFRPLTDQSDGAAWLDGLVEQLAETAREAAASLRPVEVTYASSHLDGLAVQRRAALFAEGEKLPIDRELIVITLRDEAGRRCLLTNFACHAVTVQVQPLISGDFPGVAMQALESTLAGCECAVFLQGADGDINPPQVRANFDDVAEFARILTEGVVRLAEGTTEAQPVALATRSTVLDLPSRPLPAGDDFSEEQQVRIGWGTGPLAGEVQVLRLGNLAVVGLPGEPFVELGLAIKARSTAAHTLVVGYANDYLGYLTTPRAWEQGGYEIALGPWSRVSAEASGMLVEAALRLIKELF
jgi:neutral ceramidase